jgi:uncharacterized protein with PIN domain
MSDNLENRRRASEEDYFRKKDQEAIEKLREKMRVAQQAQEAGQSSMRCPRCTGTLVETKFEDVMIDRCDNCSGIWLDPGELAQLLQKDTSGWFRRWWGGE